jgi:hypothetical protein
MTNGTFKTFPSATVSVEEGDGRMTYSISIKDGLVSIHDKKCYMWFTVPIDTWDALVECMDRLVNVPCKNEVL